MKKILKWSAIGFGGFIILVIIIGIIAGEPDEETPRLYPGRGDTQRNDRELRDGDAATLLEYMAQAKFDSVIQDLGSFYTADLGKQFVAFEVTVRNDSDRSHFMGRAYFRLQTPSGLVVDPYYSGRDPQLESEDLIPGGSMSGYLTFQIPAVSGWHYLIMKPDLFRSDRLIWGINLEEANAPPAAAVETPTTGPTPTATPTPGPRTEFGDGVWRVGIDIQPGTYRTEGTASCYWARLSGFGGGTSDILANANPRGPSVVTIRPTDAGFESQRCGTWALQKTP